MTKYRTAGRIILLSALVTCTGFRDAAAAAPPAYHVTDLGTLKQLEIPTGYKAFTVKCSPVDAVAGFAKPGAKVDVMFVENGSDSRLTIPASL